MRKISMFRGKVKFGFCVVVLFVLVPSIMFIEHKMDSLHAAGTAPTYSLYEKVHIANNTYTVIGTGSNINLLMDTTIGSAQTWATANTTATNFPSAINIGILGNEVLKNKYSLPTSTNLSSTLSGTTLHANIPTVSNDWWLGDASSNNRSKFMTATNSNNGSKSLTSTTIDSTTGACGTTSVNETGAMVTARNQEANKTANIWTKREATATMAISGNANLSNFAAYEGSSNCSGTSVIGNTQLPNSLGATISVDNINNLEVTVGALSGKVLYRLFVQNYPNFESVFKSASAGSTYYLNLGSNVCYDLSRTPGGYTSMKLPQGQSLSITFTVKDNPIDTTELKTCTGQTWEAGTALTRAMLSLPLADIVSANTSKRLCVPANTLSDSFPTSDTGNSKPYLTLLNPNLKVALTTGASGVSGTTYSSAMPSDYILKLPVTLTGNKEGGQYVSASASIGGVSKYGVLKQTTTNNDIVEIDLRQFASDPSTLTQLQLTLYHENAGSYQTAYMGNGTDITVNLLASQDISFASGNTTTATYGELTSISAQLDTPLNKQSSAPIKFTVISGNASIDSQSYIASTGIASANIKPTSGTGNVVIAIDKAGDTTAAAASQQTFTLALNKKSISVKPNSFTRTYTVNEAMPLLSSVAVGLVSGDTIPTALVPILEPLDGSAASPATGGMISNVGKWKQVYHNTILNALPTEFTNKYNITLADWDDDQSFVFQTSLTAIPEGWLIVTPNANSDGWNNTDVSVALSQDAQNMGYHTIEAVNTTGDVIKYGASLLYSTETSGEIPKVRIVSNTHTSEAIDLRTLKIDKTKPVIASVSVDKELDWAVGKKTISISASDATSNIKEVTATCGGQTYRGVLTGSAYTFDANQNGTYTIIVSDYAGNATTTTQVVSMITQSSISLSAIAETLTTDQPRQKITITRDAGASGIKNFNVYYEQAGTFVLLEALDQTVNPLDWYAEMNGTFRFEIENNAGEKMHKDVVITQVNPPVPVTQIKAYWQSNPTTTYASGTWVNEDIVLEIENANTAVSDPVVWEYSEDNGTTWNTLSDNPLTVSTTSGNFINKTYRFKAKVDKGGVGDVHEISAKSFTVRIDKTDPNIPVINGASNYTQSDWYATAQTITSTVSPKASSVTQSIYVCEAPKTDCESDPSKWTITNAGTVSISQNGTHELYFKAIDDAGNESALTAPIYVNINNEAPEITIKIENNPIKNLINDLTFGFFYKESVDIDIEADFGTGQSGIMYYIVDETGGAVPTDSDSRWIEGDAFSLTPEKKAMVYVKAVSDANIIGRDSSIYDIYVDTQKPTITASPDTTWTNDDTLQVMIDDTNSGVDPKTVTYNMNGGALTLGSYANGILSITSLQAGEYDVEVHASDHSANASIEVYAVKIDTSKPTISQPTADVSGWTKEKTITFTPGDSLSGIDRVSVKQSDGSSITATVNGDGSYSFVTTENDTYRIQVSDLAGNEETLDYVETKIDLDGPIIQNVTIADEDDWKASKSVSFDVIDGASGINSVSVSFDNQGVVENVHVNAPVRGDTYSFTAQATGEYTITAIDQAGNTTTKIVTVEKISTAGIRISNISDTSTWVKDVMSVSFDVAPGESGLKTGSVKVMHGGASITVIEQGGSYEFIATENGVYEISAENNAGDNALEQITISKIDLVAPVVENVSSNTTAPSWREPQDISFHVVDYNDSSKTTIGSGIKNGYPKVYYMNGVTRIDVPIIQDASDPTLFTFHADQNTIYTVEVMDEVGHTMLTHDIPVDHIFDRTSIVPLVVKAYNSDMLIASGTWVSGSIRFELSGGLNASMLEKYQVAISNGSQPSESDWNDVNGINQHEVIGNINGDTYWFRAVPTIDAGVISTPFIVNLDNENPNQVNVNMRAINTDPIARFINALSFGNWMKESQEVSFSANDNFTPEEDMTYMYKSDEAGAWQRYSEPIIYNDTDITLYVKAIDLAGNESDEIEQPLLIDSVPPQISGVKDASEYKFYYLPRYVTVSDEASGVKTCTYQLDSGEVIPFNREVSLKAIGTYQIHAADIAGNETNLTFKIVSLPSLEDIDGSDESRDIIDQIQQELEEAKDYIDANEAANYDKWLEDAENKWEAARNKELTHDKTGIKLEGIGDTTFDPSIKLIVEPIAESEIPTLPRKALAIYEVYLMKGNVVIQPNGMMKVYLPYVEKEAPIVYEIDGNVVKEISVEVEAGYVTFTTPTLKKYAISNTAQTETNKDICVVGPDEELGSKDDVCGSDDATKNPDGSVDVPPGGSIMFPGGKELETPEGGHINPDGSVTLPNGDEYDHEGNLKPKVCNIEDTFINVDTDDDGLPDLNIDYDGDCIADLNIDTNHDQVPDVEIDSNGNTEGSPPDTEGSPPDTKGSPPDGIADVNIDKNQDGKADINIVVIKEWKPNYNVSYNGFSYDTMSGLKPINESNEPNKEPSNDDKKNDSDIVNTGGSGGANTSVLGAKTGDETSLWGWGLAIFIVSSFMVGYGIRKRKI